ncbi:unnamed protein product [Heligmosomoides polygyrus]|uniref:Chromo domain-containing protein n=1 Tax=Heligmosomoides polygyrus TaxID=6339 RepID=A0A183GMP1_HELPZ|nr:unnamed protein product [Heligmosomoides polygyrus]
MIRDEVNEQASRYRGAMKRYYDARKGVNQAYSPKVGDRVFVKMPREKTKDKFPKLTYDWEGPYRVLEVSHNSALVTKICGSEEPLRVQHDLLLKCPDEVSDEPVVTNTGRKRRGARVMRGKSESNVIGCKAVLTESAYFSTEEEIVVPNEQHFLHVRFRCMGQQFPETNGRRGFQLSTCCCSRELVVKDLLMAVPSPAAEERIECVLDAARILTLWWGPDSISKKVQWICDRNHLALNIKAVGVACAFFRAKCSYVLLMCGLLPQSSRLRHPLLKGWPYDVTRIVEYGFEIGRRLDWSAAAPTATLSDEHTRVIVVVPECLTSLKHCMAGPHTTFFFYRTFFDLKKKHTKLFVLLL